MRFAINPATTMPYSFEDDVRAYRNAGITHMELWMEKVETYLQEHSLQEARDLLAETGIEPVAACCIAGVMLQNVTETVDTLAEVRARLELSRELGCRTVVAVPDFPKRVSPGMYGKVERNLRSLAALAADHDVRIAIEFLQSNTMLASLATAKQLVRGVAHPAMGIVLDMSHFWMDRSHLEDIDDLTPEELFLVHIDDMAAIEPERMTDYDRTFPGKGRGIDREIAPRIAATGYQGFWSVEVFNRSVWEQPVDQIATDAAASMAYFERAYGGAATG